MWLTLDELLGEVLDAGGLLPLLGDQLVPHLLQPGAQLAHLRLQRRPLPLQGLHLLLPLRLLLPQPLGLGSGGDGRRDPGKRRGSRGRNRRFNRGVRTDAGVQKEEDKE